MFRYARLLGCLVMVAGLSACGGPAWSGHYIPVDSELKPFTPPEADDLVQDDDEEDDDEDYEEYVDEEEEEETPAPAAPTPPTK